LEAFLSRTNRPAAIVNVGQVHSDLPLEWEKRAGWLGSLPWLKGTTPASDPKKIAGLQALLTAPEPPRPAAGDVRARGVYGRWFTAGEELAKQRVTGRKPDLVLLSSGTRFNPQRLTEATSNFGALVREQGARPVLWATALSKLGLNPFRTPADEAKTLAQLDGVFLDLARRPNLTVAPVYRAAIAILKRPEVRMDELKPIDAGFHHYGPKHGYLFACVLYAAIKCETPVGLPVPRLWPKGDKDTGVVWFTLNPAEAKVMQDVAWTAWNDFQRDVAQARTPSAPDGAAKTPEVTK
jgi:hypothetical protein